MINSKNLLIFASLSSLLLSACAGSGGNSDPTLVAPQVLAQNDLQALTSQESWQVSSYNSTKNNAFSKVFGGTSGYNVRSYMDQRLKHFLSEGEFDQLVNTIDPNSLKSPSYSDGDEPQVGTPAKVEVSASNYGALLFLLGAVNKRVARTTWKNQELVFDTPRVGLMVTGPGYISHVKKSDGQWIEVPSSYRQAILVHEARHSDCTGGMTQTTIDAIASAKTKREFDSALQRTNCSHFHTICPTYHKLHGIAACDSKAWGPYAIDAIFAAARASSASGIEKALLEATAADAATRVTGVSFYSMLNGVYGDPDMSSSKPEIFQRENR